MNDIIVQTITEGVNKFISSDLKNQWIEMPNDEAKIYLRKTQRVINNEVMKIIDLGSINIHPDFQKQKIGSTIINHIHIINPFQCTYVENVLNPVLEIWLRKNDWIECSVGYISFYKIK